MYKSTRDFAEKYEVWNPEIYRHAQMNFQNGLKRNVGHIKTVDKVPANQELKYQSFKALYDQEGALVIYGSL